MSRAHAAVVLLAAAVASIPISRADLREEFTPPDPSGWYGRGAFRFLPALSLRDVGYDSNVFLVSEAADPRGDFTATVSPSLLGWLRMGGRSYLTLRVDLDYVWFSQFSSQTHTNVRLAARANTDFRLLRLTAGGGYESYEERPSNEIDQRTRRDQTALRGGIGFEISSRTAVDLLVRRDDIAFSDEDFLYRPPCRIAPDFPYRGCPSYTVGDLLSRVEESAGLRFTRGIGGRSLVALDVLDRRYRFTGPEPDESVYSTPPVVGPRRDTTERRLTAAIEMRRGGLVEGIARLGVTDFDPETLTSQKTRRPVGDLDLSWRLAERLRLRTRADRDLYFSTYGQNVYFEQTHRLVQCVVYAHRKVGIEAMFEAYRLFYPAQEPFVAPLYDEPREDVIRSVGAGLRIRVRGSRVLSLRAEQRHRVSNLPGVDDRRLVVTTGVESAF